MSDGNRETELDYKNRLNAKLQDSGEIDQLKQYLRQRLNESGWTAEMKSVCKGKSTLLLLAKFYSAGRFFLYFTYFDVNCHGNPYLVKCKFA